MINTVCNRKKTLIRDKLAYPGSLSASLSQELIAAYPWLAYPVAYPVAASRRCGQRLGGGRRLAGRRRLGGGGGSATAAPRSRLRLEGRGGRRRPAWRATARWPVARRRAAGGGSAAAAWQRRRFGVSSAFAYRSAYRSAYPGAYPCLSQVTDIISMVYGSTGVPAPGLSNARNASASGPIAPIIFSS